MNSSKRSPPESKSKKKLVDFSARVVLKNRVGIYGFIWRADFRKNSRELMGAYRRAALGSTNITTHHPDEAATSPHVRLRISPFRNRDFPVSTHVRLVIFPFRNRDFPVSTFSVTEILRFDSKASSYFCVQGVISPTDYPQNRAVPAAAESPHDLDLRNPGRVSTLPQGVCAVPSDLVTELCWNSIELLLREVSSRWSLLGYCQVPTTVHR